jgi:hypothetical protein
MKISNINASIVEHKQLSDSEINNRTFIFNDNDITRGDLL